MIEFRNIDFTYKKEHPIFTDFSLRIEGGKKIAFVGQSGAGKTTLIKLLLGFVRPQSGSILVDGQDLTEVSLKSYYRYIGYLPQEPAVFDGTLYENLIYGLPDGISPSAAEVE